MNRAWLVAPALAGILAAGCSGGPTGEDLQPSTTRLHVVATYVDSVAPAIEILAWLVPGVTAEGRVREVFDPVLDVSGRRVSPTRYFGQPGELKYEARWEVEPDDLPRTALTFDPPPVAGVSPIYGPVRWFTFGRAGPRTLTWTPGEDLVIDVAPPLETSSPLPGQIGADLVLSDDSGRILTLRVPLSPVDPIVVPAELMPESPDGTLRALLAVSQHRPDFEPGEEYEIAVLLAARIHWEIQVSGATD